MRNVLWKNFKVNRNAGTRCRSGQLDSLTAASVPAQLFSRCQLHHLSPHCIARPPVWMDQSMLENYNLYFEFYKIRLVNEVICQWLVFRFGHFVKFISRRRKTYKSVLAFDILTYDL